MRKFCLICCIFFSCGSWVFAQEINFQYDVSGNQIVRQWVCINCLTAKSAMLASVQIDEQKTGVTDVLTGNTLPERKLMAYPNPLTEILNVKWWADEKVYIKAIEVFSINGIRVYRQNCSAGQTETTISFLNLLPEVYLLKAVYSDEKQEIRKIIKL